MKSKQIWRFRGAKIYADVTQDGETTYRLMHHGALVATDDTPKYLKEIMYQIVGEAEEC